MITEHTILLVVVILLQINHEQACPDDCICNPESGRWDCNNAHITSINVDNDIVDLSLASNDIIVLSNEFFAGQLKIEILYLNDNGMEKIAPAAFRGLEELQFLYLYNNKLQSLHASVFNNNFKLKTLDLSGNLFTELTPGLFQANNLLSFVNFTGNNLCFSSLSSDIFNDSLNVMRIEFCEEPHPYASFLQNSTAILEELDQRRRSLIYQVKIGEKSTQMLSNNLNVTINQSDFQHNRGMMKNETSLMCFCDQLFMWFWCDENDFNCVKPMKTVDMYSFLGCSLNLEDMYKWPATATARNSTDTSLITSEINTESDQNFSTAMVPTTSETVENQDFNMTIIPATSDEDSSNSTSSENLSDDIHLPIMIGTASAVAVVVMVVVTVICTVVRRKRRREKESANDAITLSELRRLQHTESENEEDNTFRNKDRIG